MVDIRTGKKGKKNKKKQIKVLASSVVSCMLAMVGVSVRRTKTHIKEETNVLIMGLTCVTAGKELPTAAEIGATQIV